MTHEQMIAWLTLEGYVAHRTRYWEGVLSPDGVLTFIYHRMDDGRRSLGVAQTSCWGKSIFPHTPFPDITYLEALYEKISA